MADPVGLLTFKHLWQTVAQMLYGRHEGLDGSYLDNSKRIANLAYQEFLSLHDWHFLSPSASVQAVGAETSTADGVPVDAGGGTTTVNVDDAIFKEAMATLTCSVEFEASENTYPIATYTDTTTVVVTGDATGEADEDTVKVVPVGKAAMPDDFGYLIEPFAFGPEHGDVHVEERLLSSIRDERSVQGTVYTNRPLHFALHIVAPDNSGDLGQRWFAEWFPDFSVNTLLYYRYRVIAPDMAADADHPYGSNLHAPALRQAARQYAEREKSGKPGGEAAMYDTMIASAIRRDKDTRPANLGRIIDQSDGRIQYPNRSVVTVIERS